MVRDIMRPITLIRLKNICSYGETALEYSYRNELTKVFYYTVCRTKQPGQHDENIIYRDQTDLRGRSTHSPPPRLCLTPFVHNLTMTTTRAAAGNP